MLRHCVNGVTAVVFHKWPSHWSVLAMSTRLHQTNIDRQCYTQHQRVFLSVPWYNSTTTHITALTTCDLALMMLWRPVQLKTHKKRWQSSICATWKHWSGLTSRQVPIIQYYITQYTTPTAMSIIYCMPVTLAALMCWASRVDDWVLWDVHEQTLSFCSRRYRVKKARMRRATAGFMTPSLAVRCSSSSNVWDDDTLTSSSSVTIFCCSSVDNTRWMTLSRSSSCICSRHATTWNM